MYRTGGFNLKLLALFGCRSTGGEFFSETVDSLHARNSPLRTGYKGSNSLSSASAHAQR